MPPGKLPRANPGVTRQARPIPYDGPERDIHGRRVTVWRVWYPVPDVHGNHLGRPLKTRERAQFRADVFNKKEGYMTNERVHQLRQTISFLQSEAATRRARGTAAGKELARLIDRTIPTLLTIFDEVAQRELFEEETHNGTATNV